MIFSFSCCSSFFCLKGKSIIAQGNSSKIDFVARAPKGKEVEELSKRDVLKCLELKVDIDAAFYLSGKKVTSQRRSKFQSKQKYPQKKKAPQSRDRYVEKRYVEIKKEPAKKMKLDSEIIKHINKLKESMKAVILNEKNKTIKQTTVGELIKNLEKAEKPITLVFDGVITQRIVDIASTKGIKMIIGHRKGSIGKKPISLRLYIFDEISQE